jgi:hypothetical protein
MEGTMANSDTLHGASGWAFPDSGWSGRHGRPGPHRAHSLGGAYPSRATGAIWEEDGSEASSGGCLTAANDPSSDIAAVIHARGSDALFTSIAVARLDGNDGSTGANAAAGPPAAATFASIPTLADYLVNGYWGGSPRNWGSTNPITVNVQGLTAAEQHFAFLADSLWHDVCNVNFSYTTGAADITYVDSGSGVAT